MYWLATRRTQKGALGFEPIPATIFLDSGLRRKDEAGGILLFELQHASISTKPREGFCPGANVQRGLHTKQAAPILSGPKTCIRGQLTPNPSYCPMPSAIMPKEPAQTPQLSCEGHCNLLAGSRKRNR